jgi:hypothetical protein
MLLGGQLTLVLNLNLRSKYTILTCAGYRSTRKVWFFFKVFFLIFYIRRKEQQLLRSKTHIIIFIGAGVGG